MAPRTKAHINPALITWARQSAGFALAEAATALGLDEGKLAEWENPQADEGPSIPQLRKVAALFKRPLAVFYMSEAPKDFQAMRDLRRLPGTGEKRYSPALQLEIRAAFERRELAQELATDLGEDIKRFALTATQRDDPEEIAARVRTDLGVTDDIQAKWKDHDGRTAFNAWRQRIEDTGVLVFQTTRFSSEEACGFAISADTFPVIAVNRKDAISRRTFSLLHELTHLMLKVSGVSELETDVTRRPEDQVIEIFCNQVAAAALVPKGALLADPRVIEQGVRSTNWSDGLLSDLARQFGVSREALVRRLLTFDRTTQDFYTKKRAQYLAEYAANKARQKESAADTDMKRNMPVETISNFGRPLVRMVLGNYYSDRLTLSEVSGYLGLKVKHIPKLEKVAGVR